MQTDLLAIINYATLYNNNNNYVSSQTAFEIYMWFILFLRVRECELIIKMESLDHSAELGLELDHCSKRSYSLLRDMLPPLETLVVTVHGSD